MPATSIDPERGDAARDPFDAELQALKRKNRQNRQALDHVLAEIHSRMAESPRQRLAADLLQILVGENLTEIEGEPWRLIPEMAEKCLEAAGKIYPEIDQPADSAFHVEILRQNAVMEGVIERLDTDVEARRARWGGLDKVPINPGGHFMPLGAIGRDPEGYFQSATSPPAAVEGAQAVAGGFAGEDNWGDEHRRAMAFYDAQDAGKEAE